jgi:hypothetical protein
MCDDVINAVFIMDYKSTADGTKWENIPDSLWRTIVQNLWWGDINGVAFQNVRSKDELLEIPLLRAATVDYTGMAAYEPYHADSSPQIAVFALSTCIEQLLLSQDLDQWNRANYISPIDEILFFAGKKIKMQVVPYENIILFYQLSRREYGNLFSLDERIRHNLYLHDLSRLVIESS